MGMAALRALWIIPLPGAPARDDVCRAFRRLGAILTESLRAPDPMTSIPCRSMRRTTVLIVGCGDVGFRAARLLRGRCRVLGLSASLGALPGRREAMRAAGIVPIAGDLDDPGSLARLAGLASHVLHLAPPPALGSADPRTAHLLQALARRGRRPNLVYASTSGVYGDCGGAWIDETRAVAPASERARRRVDAEAGLRRAGRGHRVRACVLRIPGIYAGDRAGGHPRERLRRAAPVLRAEDDVYTNHIHADDLARACIAALWRGTPQRVYHASDDTRMRMADYMDLAADLEGLPRPPRITRDEARSVLSPMQMSFLDESRRLVNRRLKHELRLTLRYPTVREGLTAAALARSG